METNHVVIGHEFGVSGNQISSQLCAPKMCVTMFEMTAIVTVIQISGHTLCVAGLIGYSSLFGGHGGIQIVFSSLLVWRSPHKILDLSFDGRNRTFP